MRISGTSGRYPWSTCPGALAPLERLAGMPLAAASSAVRRWTEPRAQCTHLLDLAGLAVAHAAAGRVRRGYEVEIPDRVEGRSHARLRRNGEPLLDFEMERGTIVSPAPFAGQPSCPGASSCANTLMSGALTSPTASVCGTAQAEVSFHCTTTGKSTTGTATIEQGCCGQSAQACRSKCGSEQNQGMCGSPCDLCGPAAPPFSPTVHACWRVNVNGTWFCYWDLTAPGAPGFVDLCCPNRCEGVSNTPWIGAQTDPFLCTVSERCADNPAFGDADQFGPGRRCVPAVGDI